MIADNNTGATLTVYRAYSVNNEKFTKNDEIAEGDTVVVTSGVWEKTVGVIKRVDEHKQVVTINVDMFGRETPVEISFTDVKKMD